MHDDSEPTTVAATEATPVLIVGGGLTGLSTALFLAWHGVKPLLVERHPDLLIHPRARGFTPRTVELFRQVGLEPAIREKTFASGEVFAWYPVRGETLAGELTPVEEPDEKQGVERFSPSSFAPIDQDKLEVLIRARAEELGADIRFSTEMVAFETTDAGVVATLRDRHTGHEYGVRADYLVAADGATSRIRQRLGIATDGPGPFFQVLSLMVEADLRPALRGRPVSIAYLEQPRPGTIFLAHDNEGLRWVFGTGYSPEHGESLDDFPDQRCVEMVRAGAGLPDVAVTIRPQIPGTDMGVLGFPIGAQVARQYRAGPVFLVGDAAHIVPPTGGLGANTGIQDAHNLAWKLAAVLHSQAGAALLDTYEGERHPVGILTMQQALARWEARVGEGTEEAQELDWRAVAFGYQYRSPAIVGAADDTVAALLPSQLAAQPGTRAPHVWLTRNGERISTIDLYGRDFVLLTGPDGAGWIEATRTVRDGLTAHQIGGGNDLTDPDGAFASAYDLAPGGAVVVRPDGFVAWRPAPGESPSPETLQRVLRQVLPSP